MARIALLPSSLVLTFGLSLAACGAEDGGRTAGGPACVGAKCDAAGDADDGEVEEHAEHLEAVQGCEAAADRQRERTHDLRYDAQGAIERERQGCLSDANDDILSAIDDLADSRASDDDDLGEIASLVGRFRDAREAVCTKLVEASEGAQMKAGAVMEQACGAQSELDLANLIGRYVDLGVDPITLAGSRTRYPQCWDSWDDASEAADDDGAKLTATVELYDCISEDNGDAKDELVGRIADAFPGRASETLEEDVEQAFRSYDNIAQDVCHVFAVAGHTTDADEVELDWVQCQVHAAGMVGNLGDLIVPGVWPEGEPDGGGEPDPGDGDGEPEPDPEPDPGE